jgi:hypothetical protein
MYSTGTGADPYRYGTVLVSVPIRWHLVPVAVLVLICTGSPVHSAGANAGVGVKGLRVPLTVRYRHGSVQVQYRYQSLTALDICQ